MRRGGTMPAGGWRYILWRMEEEDKDDDELNG